MTITNNILYSTQNGNCKVVLESNGSRTISWRGKKKLEYPTNMDIKITNYCDMDKHCVFCHEQSNKLGKHGDLLTGIQLLKDLPKGTEIAIGGGNPLSHPKLREFLIALKDLDLVANITVNQLHINQFLPIIQQLIEENLIKGIGVSYRNSNIENILKLYKISNNVIIHLIAGVDSLAILDILVNNISNAKILILGYKTFGNGIQHLRDNTFQVESKLFEWKTELFQYFGVKGSILSFDNLAIKQLDIRRFFDDGGWEKFYQGDDGEGSMYVDLVKKEYCLSSTAKQRFEIGAKNMKQIFGEIQNLASKTKKKE